jgi:teichuronic acid biosynthesis glycosyltransferase TuaC
LALIPGARLLIVGDGPERAALEHLAIRLNVGERIQFLGRVAHERLPEIYSAADILVLASSREGWANVLLEAMACGTPVVASDVWGTPEVVAGKAAGRLVKDRTGAAFAEAIRHLLALPPRREETRAYAEGFSWDATTAGQLALFREILGHR